MRRPFESESQSVCSMNCESAFDVCQAHYLIQSFGGFFGGKTFIKNSFASSVAQHSCLFDRPKRGGKIVEILRFAYVAYA